MLAGQVISLGDSAVISLTGLLIVMLELAFLAVFIQIMSRVLAAIVKKKGNTFQTQLTPSGSEEEDDIAVIMTTVLEETGWSMEKEAVFHSIVRIQ